MKKRHILIPVIILLVVIGIPCLINTSNFYLASNSMFYRTVSDYPNTTWVCQEPKAVIKVMYEQSSESVGIKSILEVESDGKKTSYVISNRVEIFDLFLLDNDGKQISDDVNDPDGNVVRTRAKYRKNIFGEVASFQIKILNDNRSIAGYKMLKFHKED